MHGKPALRLSLPWREAFPSVTCHPLLTYESLTIPNSLTNFIKLVWSLSLYVRRNYIRYYTFKMRNFSRYFRTRHGIWKPAWYMHTLSICVCIWQKLNWDVFFFLSVLQCSLPFPSEAITALIMMDIDYYVQCIVFSSLTLILNKSPLIWV